MPSYDISTTSSNTSEIIAMIFALEWIHPQSQLSFSFLRYSDSIKALDGVRDRL